MAPGQRLFWPMPLSVLKNSARSSGGIGASWPLIVEKALTVNALRLNEPLASYAPEWLKSSSQPVKSTE